MTWEDPEPSEYEWERPTFELPCDEAWRGDSGFERGPEYRMFKSMLDELESLRDSLREQAPEISRDDDDCC